MPAVGEEDQGGKEEHSEGAAGPDTGRKGQGAG